MSASPADEWPPVPREAFARLVRLLARCGFTQTDVEYLAIRNESLFARADEAKVDEGRVVLGELARALEAARKFKGESHYAAEIAHLLNRIPRDATEDILRHTSLKGRPTVLRTKIVRYYRQHGFTADSGRTASATDGALALLLLVSGWRQNEDNFDRANRSELEAVKAVPRLTRGTFSPT